MDVSFLDGGRGGGRVGVLIVGALDDEAAFRHRAPHLPPALSLLASATEKPLPICPTPFFLVALYIPDNTEKRELCTLYIHTFMLLLRSI